MRQQIDQYLRRRKSNNHPGKDDFQRRFSVYSFNHFNVEQLIDFRYFQKDLIFISGLFFVLILHPIDCFLANTNYSPNQIMWGQPHGKLLCK